MDTEVGERRLKRGLTKGGHPADHYHVSWQPLPLLLSFQYSGEGIEAATTDLHTLCITFYETAF